MLKPASFGRRLAYSVAAHSPWILCVLCVVACAKLAQISLRAAARSEENKRSAVVLYLDAMDAARKGNR